MTVTKRTDQGAFWEMTAHSPRFHQLQSTVISHIKDLCGRCRGLMEEKVERLPILKPNADLPITKETQGKTDNLETEDVDELWETWQESLLPDQSETLLFDDTADQSDADSLISQASSSRAAASVSESDYSVVDMTVQTLIEPKNTGDTAMSGFLPNDSLSATAVKSDLFQTTVDLSDLTLLDNPARANKRLRELSSNTLTPTRSPVHSRARVHSPAVFCTPLLTSSGHAMTSTPCGLVSIYKVPGAKTNHIVENEGREGHSTKGW